MLNKASSTDVLYNFLISDLFVLSVKLDNIYVKKLCNPGSDLMEGSSSKGIKRDQLSHDTLPKYSARKDSFLRESGFSRDTVLCHCTGGEIVVNTDNI